MRRLRGTVLGGLATALLLAACEASPLSAAQPVWSYGVRSGVLVGITDLTDEESVTGHLFARRGIGPSWTLEATTGFGRIAGQDNTTNLVLADGRAIFEPFQSGSWRPYLFGGLGVSRHDIDELTSRATADHERTGWSALLPVGLGFETALTERVAFELSSTYAYSFRDDLDGASLRKGNDAIWLAQVGLAFTPAKGGRGIPPISNPTVSAARFEAPPPSSSQGPVKQLARADRGVSGPADSADGSPSMPGEPDRDGDGLSDREETTRHFTNPFMVDSDSDGLDDRSEVAVHGTNPNRPDSDEDGLGDAEEIRAGRNPLIADHSIAGDHRGSAAQKPAFELRTLYFAQGGVSMTVADRSYLDEVAGYLVANPDMELELHGYSDSVGNWADNLRLSGKRCGVVRDYLVERGVENWRLTLEAFGEGNPIASNETAAGRVRNRRVEFKPVR